MHAAVGDRIVVHGRTVDTADRTGEILEARGRDGGPPFLVGFGDGHRGLLFPGPDVQVLPRAADEGPTNESPTSEGPTSDG